VRNPDDSAPRLTEAKQRLRKTWLVWGLLPLVLVAIITLIVAGGTVNGGDRTSRSLERGFQAVFAIAAALFLTGFWLDGRWTDARRLALHLQGLTASGAARPDASDAARSRPAEPAAELQRLRLAAVFVSVYNSATALTAIGIAMACAALLAAVAGLGMNYSMILLALAAEYQVFALSRQPYYLELMQMALAGELVVPPQPVARRK
jgi:hypothetical protein